QPCSQRALSTLELWVVTRVVLSAFPVLSGSRKGDGDSDGDRRLQAKVEQGFRRNLHLLSTRGALNARSRGGASQGADGCSLAAASQRPDESAECAASTYLFCRVLTPPGGRLVIGLRYKGHLLPAHGKLRQFKREGSAARKVGRILDSRHPPLYRRLAGNGHNPICHQVVGSRAMKNLVGRCGLAVELVSKYDLYDRARIKRKLLDNRLRRRRGRWRRRRRCRRCGLHRSRLGNRRRLLWRSGFSLFLELARIRFRPFLLDERWRRGGRRLLCRLYGQVIHHRPYAVDVAAIDSRQIADCVVGDCSAKRRHSVLHAHLNVFPG